MLQTHVKNDIYNKYCLIHNTSPLQGKERFMKKAFFCNRLIFSKDTDKG